MLERRARVENGLCDARNDDAVPLFYFHLGIFFGDTQFVVSSQNCSGVFACVSGASAGTQPSKRQQSH